MKTTLMIPKKEVLEALFQKGIHPDKLVRHTDGSFTFKRSYFYRHGSSPEKYAEAIKKAIPNAVILDRYDDFAAWPKTSYFVVKFEIKGDM
jgi:hypothetical protein